MAHRQQTVQQTASVAPPHNDPCARQHAQRFHLAQAPRKERCRLWTWWRGACRPAAEGYKHATRRTIHAALRTSLAARPLAARRRAASADTPRGVHGVGARRDRRGTSLTSPRMLLNWSNPAAPPADILPPTSRRLGRPQQSRSSLTTFGSDGS